MAGYVVLEGGAEFDGKMAEVDRRAMALAGGPGASIAIIPTAAAPDNNHVRAGANGRRWFEQLGATNVQVLAIIDSSSANDPEITAVLSQARLIYLLGGFTHYLGQTLTNSSAWQAMVAARAAGAVIAGSSAGAMVLCESYFDPGAGAVVAGLNLVPGVCVLPHHNTFGHKWVANLRQRLPQIMLVGIDERTGLIDDGADGAWTVYGGGSVTLYRPQPAEGDAIEVYQAGTQLVF